MAIAAATLLARVQARLAEDPVRVREALTLIADPDALPARRTVSEAALKVNSRRLAESRQQFFAGAYKGNVVRAHLGGVSRQALNQRVRSGRLLALTAANASWFPDWQFTSAGDVLPGLDQLLAVLPASPVAADLLVRAPIPEAAGRSVADLLAAGELDLAVHYAKTAGGER
jgi:hypothetical protein